MSRRYVFIHLSWSFIIVYIALFGQNQIFPKCIINFMNINERVECNKLINMQSWLKWCRPRWHLSNTIDPVSLVHEIAAYDCSSRELLSMLINRTQAYSRATELILSHMIGNDITSSPKHCTYCGFLVILYFALNSATTICLALFLYFFLTQWICAVLL